jgi:hypothetical protein
MPGSDESPAPRPGPSPGGGPPDGNLPSALDAGRLYRRLAFHLQQAWFLGGESTEAAATAARELALQVRDSAAAAERDTLEGAVSALTDHFLEVSHSEAFVEELWQRNQELLAAHPHGHPGAARLEWLDPLFRGLAELRREVVDRLGGHGRLAFRLGELVEEGVCRPDIHAFLADDGSPEGSGSPLANRSRRPGEIPPRTGWPAQILQLWGELGLPAELLPPSITSSDVLPPEGIEDLVSQLHARAHEALLVPSSLQDTGSGGAVEAPRASPSPTAEPDEPAVVLGGPDAQPFVRGKPAARLTAAQYDVVKALLEAGPAGLAKDDLDCRSGHTDARKILGNLARKDPAWADVIHMPGTAGRRYRIR